MTSFACCRWSLGLFLVAWPITARLASVAADEPDPYKITDPVAMGDFQLTVTDGDGKPIQGVRVQATGLRVVEDRGSHYGWPVRNAGKAPQTVTDAKGNATFKVPEKIGRFPDWVHTSVVTYSLTHPEYISRRVETNESDSPCTETMVPGCELIVSAVNPQRQTIEDLGVLVAGNQPKFIPGSAPGQWRSRSIPRGRRQVMLVGPDREHHRHLFSRVLSLQFAESKKVSLRGLALEPGLEIKGKLADDVPRPVKNGVISSWSIPKPDGQVHAQENASIAWRDFAEIQPDGTFHFPSLPPTGKLQLIAICDGWVIDGSKPGDFFTRGVTYELDKQEITDHLWDDLVVPMTPTATIEVTVRTTDGKPLAGASLGTWPNQMLEMAGSQLLGAIYRSIDVVNRQWVPIEYPSSKTKERYESKTNQQGIGILRDIPLGAKSFYVTHDDYQVPLPEDNEAKRNRARDRAVNVTLDQAGVKKVDVTVEPIPKKTNNATRSNDKGDANE